MQVDINVDDLYLMFFIFFILRLLQKVSRFRGSSRSKNARSAASWFLKPGASLQF